MKAKLDPELEPRLSTSESRCALSLPLSWPTKTSSASKLFDMFFTEAEVELWRPLNKQKWAIEKSLYDQKKIMIPFWIQRVVICEIICYPPQDLPKKPINCAEPVRFQLMWQKTVVNPISCNLFPIAQSCCKCKSMICSLEKKSMNYSFTTCIVENERRRIKTLFKKLTFDLSPFPQSPSIGGNWKLRLNSFKKSFPALNAILHFSSFQNFAENGRRHHLHLLRRQTGLSTLLLNLGTDKFTHWRVERRFHPDPESVSASAGAFVHLL